MVDEKSADCVVKGRITQYRNAADLKRESLLPLIAAAKLGVTLGRPLLAGALLDRALERAPKSAELHALYGDGWTLKLNPGWKLAPGARAGDSSLVEAK